MNRRDVLRTGVAGAGVAGIAACSSPSGSAPVAAPGADPIVNQPGAHLFHLGTSQPKNFDGGSLRGASEESFPILAGQNGSVYFITLDVGGVREPHWHPSAWELNYVISGRARWTLLGTHPDGSYHNDEFDAGPGDLVFAPTGFFHYFENASPNEQLQVLAIFNSSTPEPNDDLGIVGALNSLPRAVLAASFGVPESAFAQIPKEIKPVVITRHR